MIKIANKSNASMSDTALTRKPHVTCKCLLSHSHQRFTDNLISLFHSELILKSYWAMMHVIRASRTCKLKLST